MVASRTLQRHLTVAPTSIIGLVGLGVEIKAEPGKGLLLANVLPDSPASEGGLMPGEHIVAIDGTDVRDMTTDSAAGMLQGLEGSRVSVEVGMRARSSGSRGGSRRHGGR